MEKSALNGTDGDALHEILLQSKEHNEHRQSGNGGTGHHGGKKGFVCKFELLQTDLDGIHGRVVGHQEGPEEVIPAGHKGVDSHDGQNGFGQGQDDLDEIRIRIAEAFNNAIKAGTISAPVVLGRDHHDVSGTDSPYRETSNIRDGSRFTADMAVQNFVGDAFRGATWISLHNGGGVGWGEVINGGFGMVIDGSEDAGRRIREMLLWDVNNGIARRSWARNEGAVEAIRREMDRTPGLRVTLPVFADEKLVREALNEQGGASDKL